MIKEKLKFYSWGNREEAQLISNKSNNFDN